MEKETRIKTINQVPRRAGCRITSQRKAILDDLGGNKDHLSVNAICHHVRRQFPPVALSPMDTSLTFLDKREKIWVLGIKEETNYRDENQPPSPPHLICPECDSICDLSQQEWISLIWHAPEAHGSRLNI
jgi:Fe2+ or Zn2+ uptake regulation protein